MSNIVETVRSAINGDNAATRNANGGMMNPINRDPNTLTMKVDINNYLNIKNSLYLDTLRGASLSTPKLYFNYRQQVNEYIKTESISNLYNVLFNAMKDGRRLDGRTTIATEMIGGSPNISELQINEVCISIAKTLDKMLTEVVEMLCPTNITGNAQSRAQAAGNSNGIEI